MRISCIQMNMSPNAPEKNRQHLRSLMNQAAAESPDVIVLPELWDVGFFPETGLEESADPEGRTAQNFLSSLAREHSTAIVGGSIAARRSDGITNTSYVLDSDGTLLASYDKTHLFSPMGEHRFFRAGNHLSRFSLNGLRCGVLICYDIRFPELTRKLALEGLDILFLVSQWPDIRISQLHTLLQARAIENQCFAVCCNSCGKYGSTQYGGHSCVISPAGILLAAADSSETVLTAELVPEELREVRSRMDPLQDRRPELY